MIFPRHLRRPLGSFLGLAPTYTEQSRGISHSPSPVLLPTDHCRRSPLTIGLSRLDATLMDLPASVANKRLTTWLKPFRCNTYKKHRGRRCHGVPLVVPLYRYVASIYLLYLPLFRKHRGCGGILPILEQLPRHQSLHASVCYHRRCCWRFGQESELE